MPKHIKNCHSNENSIFLIFESGRFRNERSRNWTALKVDGIGSGRSQKWTVSKVDGFERGRSQNWTVLKVDGIESGRSQKWTV